MLARLCRTAAILVLAASVLWGSLVTHAQSSGLASRSVGGAGALLPTAIVVYNQPPRPDGKILPSSLLHPDGSDSDRWVWDGFVLNSNQDITELRWRGGHDPARLGSMLPVVGFTVSIYTSVPSGFQPDLAQPPLVHYEVATNANETPAGVLGGVQMYDYRYALPVAFRAAAHTKYWVQIEAWQPGAPDWGLAAATGGDGSYLLRIAGEGSRYHLLGGDAAFALLAPGTDGYRLYLSVLHAGSR